MGERDEFEEYIKATISNGTVGRQFLEKVLLAFIKGSNDQEHPQNQEKRLREAMIAITGKHYSQGKKQINDNKLLLYMAARYLNSTSVPNRIVLGPMAFGSDSFMPYDSLTELARDALNYFDAWSGSTGERAQTQRLMDKFTENKEYFCNSIMYADHEVHVAEHELLKRLKYLFELADVEFCITDEPQAW